MRTHKQTNERRNTLNQLLNSQIDSLIRDLSSGILIQPETVQKRQNNIENLRVRIQETDWQLGIETILNETK